MKTNIKTVISVLTLLASVVLLSSFSSLSVCNGNSLVGKWLVVSTEEYDKSGALQSKETAQNVSWEINEQAITVHDKNDELDGIPLSYAVNDKKIILDKLALSYTIRELTDSKLVIQSSVLGDMYVVITFKKTN